MRLRGFEIVKDEFRKHPEKEIIVPRRSDVGSAGYDFYNPTTITIPAKSVVIVHTDVKAYMLQNELLALHVRSSIGLRGITLAMCTGIIDSSFYNNIKCDGNICMALCNTNDNPITLKEDERICQGIFTQYLTIDNDVPVKEVRQGGLGSTGRK